MSPSRSGLAGRARPGTGAGAGYAWAAVSVWLLAGCTPPGPLPSDPSFPRSAEELALTPQELLGKRLFQDTALSEPSGQGCVSCHDPARAFQGNAGSPIPAVAAGSRAGVVGGRNVPSTMYAALAPPFAVAMEADPQGQLIAVASGGLFLDGRAQSLEEQARGPFLNPLEMNNKSAAAVVAKVQALPYAALVTEVLGRRLLRMEDAFAAITEAIAAYERTPVFAPFNSRFDGWLVGRESFTAREERGFSLFVDREKGNCIACHVGELGSRAPSDWPFTDFTYDNLGVPRNPSLPANADRTYFDLGLCGRPGLEAALPPGAAASDLCGAFKVPTLRNVAVTGPYMHNGVFTKLRDVVRFYVTRDTRPEDWYPRAADGTIQKFDDLPPEYHENVNTVEPPYDRKLGEVPRLSEAEIDDLVAFLETLTDRPRPAGARGLD